MILKNETDEMGASSTYSTNSVVAGITSLAICRFIGLAYYSRHQLERRDCQASAVVTLAYLCVLANIILVQIGGQRFLAKLTAILSAVFYLPPLLRELYMERNILRQLKTGAENPSIVHRPKEQRIHRLNLFSLGCLYGFSLIFLIAYLVAIVFIILM